MIAAFVLVLLDFNVAATVQVLAIGCVVPLLVSALHELGHAAVGAVVGFRIHQVSFGAGRTKARFRLGSVDIRLRSRLVGGWVANFPPTVPGIEQDLL
ncbi:MAG: hypothetical protein R2710_22570 [Acidimicrobiales bacterium]